MVAVGSEAMGAESFSVEAVGVPAAVAFAVDSVRVGVDDVPVPVPVVANPLCFTSVLVRMSNRRLSAFGRGAGAHLLAPNKHNILAHTSSI